MYQEFIMSSINGTIEEVLINIDSRIYEWETLFTIKTVDGELKTVNVGLSGKVCSLEVQKGDRVIPGMVLAYIKEDFILCGSD